MHAALVQLRLDESFLKSVKGVKFMGAASVGVDERVIREEWGELLFTDYGISGPPVFQLSRSAGEQLNEGKTPWIKVDMFPEVPEPELYEGMRIRVGYQPQKPTDFSFVGLINKRLIPAVLKAAGIEDIHKPCGELSDDEFNNIVGILKRWKMRITGTQSWTDAQVTAGGIDVNDVNPKTMESKLVGGLYFCGEVVDIDGDCGGFNLQWAWSSGYIAGLHAATD
jgi:predicted Rossmann fold flavoprotein